MIKLDDAGDGRSAFESPDPHAFVPPISGTASNGLPIYSWDQAAAQLTRESNGWVFTPGPVTVSYAFRSSIAEAAMPDDASIFSRFSAVQIAAAERALQLWSDVANIVFQRVLSTTPGSEAYSNSAAILFANYSAGVAGASAFAYYPYPTRTGAQYEEGDVWVNITLSENTSPLNGTFGQQVLAHEIGHAIGLSHPGNYDGGSPSYPANATYWQDARMFTVMSYFGSSGTGGSLNAFAGGPQLHDIAAAQLLYGANLSTRTSDTTYGFNSNTGLEHYTITPGNMSPAFSIWDAGGNDTIDFSGYATATEIDLREEAFSSGGPGNGGAGVAVGNISIARGAVIENAIGGAGADTLIGNAYANTLTGNNGNDTLSGNGGADTLDGRAGFDRMDGGDGNDIIIWDASDDLVNVRGGAGTDTLVFIGGAAPTSFNLAAQGFEAAEGRFTDTGALPWATRTDVYDSQWRFDRLVFNNDDGSSTLTDYDQNSAFNWRSSWNHYDTPGRRDITTVTYDDNSSDVLYLDAPAAKNWQTNWNRYDAAGQRTISTIKYDDDRSEVLYLDPSNTKNWQTNWNQYDSAGQRTISTVRYDDGRSEILYLDPNDTRDWTTNWSRFDDQGREDMRTISYDNGTRAALDFDQADAFDWATMWWLYDANGYVIHFVGTNDDGSTF